ncbi:MAG: T9SS type A sorting domain-containing protein [Chitinispirillales bacterium]|jgi:hypothetical protein|nr:T9SS type A sorting domain-containing protein [Chitinispirillales bacterium]
MGRFTKRMVLGLAAALAVAGGAFADSVLDNFEGGSNANRFGAYWYFYTNTYAARASGNPTGCDQKDYTAALVDSKLEMIDNATKSGNQLLFTGSYGSDLVAPHGGQYSGVMKFSNLLSPWKSATTKENPDVYPGVGMGTGLTTDTINGMGSGFTSAKKIKFWMRVSDADLVVKFKIEFATQIAGNGNSWPCNADASYEVVLPEPSTAWKEYEINIEASNSGSGATCAAPKLCRPTWETGKPYTYDLSKALKVAWFLEGSSNGTTAGAEGQIAIDDISIEGYTFVDKWLCTSCIKNDSERPADSLLFSNFDNQLPETQSLAQNRLKQYWYAYSDNVARGTQGTPSTIDDGQWNDPYYPDGPSLIINDESNVYGVNGSHGAYIQFTMGTPFTKNGESVQPFVGIGTNLADSNSVYNGANLTKIWLRYKTVGFEELFVEFHDEYAVSHDDGEVFYTKLPGTNGEWNIAEIPLTGDVLKLPSWAKNRTGALATFDKTKLTKLQFKNQSTNDGVLVLDDIYFFDPTIAGGVEGPVSVKSLGSKAKVSGLRAVYSRGKIGVNWNAGTSVASGSVQLVNTKGRVVASAPIATTAGKVTANLGANTIPTGMYFVRVNAKDVNGKKIVSQAPISVVK